jgi:phage FluMu protein Com/uncharacterized membrane protein
MPIEFRCTNCNKLLRTGDGTAGKQAKCPECGTLLVVPDTSTAAPTMATPATGATPLAPPPLVNPPLVNPLRSGPFAAAHSDPSNPYRSPQAGAYLGPVGQTGEIVPTRIDIGDVFGRTWKIYKANMGKVIGVVVLAMLITYVFSIGINLLIGGVKPAGRAGSVLGFVVSSVLNQFFGAFIGGGEIFVLLKIARGEEAAVGELFTGGRWLLPLFMGGLLVSLMCFVGFLLVIVPGIIVALMYSQFYFLVVDRGLGIMDALRMSNEITRGNKMTLFAIWVLLILLMIPGILTCGVGMIFILPYMMLLATVAYLTMTGQPTVDQMQAQHATPMG